MMTTPSIASERHALRVVTGLLVATLAADAVFAWEDSADKPVGTPRTIVAGPTIEQKLLRVETLVESSQPGAAGVESVLRESVEDIRNDPRASLEDKRRASGAIVDYVINGLLRGLDGFEDKMRAEAEALYSSDPEGTPSAVAAYHVLLLDHRESDGRFRPEALEAALVFHERFPKEVDIFARLATEILRSADFHDDAATALRTIEALREKLPEHAWTKEAERRIPRLQAMGKEFVVEGRLLDGSSFDSSALKGKVVVVLFWSSVVLDCRIEAYRLRRLYEELHDSGLEIVAVSLDRDRGSLETYVEEHKIPGHHLFPEGFRQTPQDHPLLQQYGLDGVNLPIAFVVDRDGKLVSTSRRDYRLEKLIRQLLAPPPEQGPPGDSNPPSS